MDKLITIHLELTYKDPTGVLSVADMHYCSPNQNISLLGVVGVRELPNDANLL